jgi:hypothetical protein
MSAQIIDGLDVDRLRMMGRIRKLWPEFKPELPEPFGESGVCVSLRPKLDSDYTGSIIVTQAEHDGAEWVHASVAFSNGVMPLYTDLVALKDAVFGPDREAYQVFPPAARHVNIHPTALHLWGRADGSAVLPLFGQDGTI